MSGWSFRIDVVRVPIGWWESDSPESRTRMFKFNANLTLARLIGSDIDDSAGNLFPSLAVLERERVFGLDRQT